MNRVFYSIIAILTVFLVQNNFPQTVHDVTVSNFSFTPSQLTINAGDVVRWTNIGGLHNVVADDNSFSSGAVSSSAWVYEHTFNSTGSNPYYCAQHGGPGGSGMSGIVTVENATDVNDNSISVYKFELEQNYPNPFNPNTTISYQLPVSNKVTLIVYNIVGDEVATLVNEEKSAGSYRVNFDASSYSGGLSSGIYFYKLQAGPYAETKEMILLK